MEDELIYQTYINKSSDLADFSELPEAKDTNRDYTGS